MIEISDFFIEFSELGIDKWSELDRLTLGQQDEISLVLLRNQLRFAYETTDFVRQWMKENDYHPNQLQSVKDIPKIPIMNKTVIRKYAPMGFGLIPDYIRKAYFNGKSKELHYDEQIRWLHWTGGTTKVDHITSNILSVYTNADVRAVTETMKRLCTNLLPEMPSLFGILYGADHIAWDVYTTLLKDQNKAYIPRIVGASSEEMAQLFEAIGSSVKDVNIEGIVGPPAAHEKKGLGLYPAFKNSSILPKKIKQVLHSSTRTPKELSDIFSSMTAMKSNDAGGSTEILPTYGDICSKNKLTSPMKLDRSFQDFYNKIFLGSGFTQILDPSGEPVKSGGIGKIYSTRVAGLYELVDYKIRAVKESLNRLSIYVGRKQRLPSFSDKYYKYEMDILKKLTGTYHPSIEHFEKVHKKFLNFPETRLVIGPATGSQFINYDVGNCTVLEILDEARFIHKQMYRVNLGETRGYRVLKEPFFELQVGVSTDGKCGV
ncbi:MAG: hypothetical protein QXK37_02365 [Candidatus Woesearchaeota archaeon]